MPTGIYQTVFIDGWLPDTKIFLNNAEINDVRLSIILSVYLRYYRVLDSSRASIFNVRKEK